MRTIYKLLLLVGLTVAPVTAPSLTGRTGVESSGGGALAAEPAVTIRVQAPSEVIQGDRFRIAYVVNTSDVDDFKVDAFEGLVELYGPSRSQSSSFSMVNGKTTSSSSVTFTYTVTTEKAGTFHVPAATVVSGGKAVKSASPQITVLPSGSGGSGQSGSSGQSAHSGGADRMRTQNVGDRITNKDIFIAVTASKKRVYEQEAVLLTYKLYTLVNISEMAGKMPELDGFHVQELNRQRQPELKMEHYNGKNYGTVVWSQYVVFPQQTGDLTIPEIKYEATIIQQNRSADPFDIFFGGGSMMQEVKKTVMAPAVTLHVDALPSPKPANFSGAVGKFSIASTLTPQQLKANDATTLRLTVSGTGNMKLMNAPEVAWPKDFERYDPKTEEKTKISANGSTGQVLFDYIAVPRHQGKYDLPPVEFCYFDPDARAYKTLTTEAYTLDIEKGKGGSSASTAGLSKEEIELLGSDIRFIKLGEPTFQTGDSAFFGSRRYWLSYVVALLVFLGLAVAFRRYAVASADLVGRRGRGASKAATKRLKAARGLMSQGAAAAFYEETMKALWGYVGDKLNIPVSELSKENVRERLAARQVSDDLVSQFIATLDECEFARFAPGDPAATMDKIYASAEEVINKMEGELKRNNK
ncbi:MAG: protein BatD [Bacteroidaceae bacterium]|nr:protein BatD [Bacteroidaceae bacterium]